MRAADIDLVVLDFDGTFTDVAKEAAPFRDAYRKNLDDLLGRSSLEPWQEEEAVIRSRPGEFGWLFGGKIVAPATADPYLLCTAVAQRIFDRLGVLKDIALRAEVSQVLYRESYRHSGVAFKEDAALVLEKLIASSLPIFVVTNSNPDVVREKIDSLKVRGAERVTVVGDAKKYVVAEPNPVDDVFARIPESRSVSGLDERPVYLRRGRYYEVLKKLHEATGVPPGRTLVCGDIWELDLALPQELGAHVHLVERSSTMTYERRAMEEAGSRGGISSALHGVLGRVGL